MALELEIAFFEENRGRWLQEHKGKYAVVKGREAVDFFDTPEAAYKAGVERFGSEAFLVKQVLEKDVTIMAPALVLGLLNAHL